MLLGSEDVEGLQLVGSGGFGSVYRGWSKKLSMEIAVKMTDGSQGADMKSLMKEKQMMARANYTYVLRLLGLYKTEGEDCQYGLVMEYMPHGTVRTLFDRIKDVPWALRFRILHQVALGMNYLHHILEPPIIHRDLKRQNILLNNSLDVQVTDFGLSKNDASVSLSLSMAGTVSHMPPEALISPTYKPTKKFDVYSYAILTWSVLSGHEPYENANMDMIKMLISQDQEQKHRPDMDLVNQWTSQKMVPEAIQLMQECWDADPSQRPSFSSIITRTNEMNAAYACEIHKEIIKVLDQLRNRNSSHSQTLDKLNCDTRSDLQSPPSGNSSSFNVSKFRNILQQAERKEADLPEPTGTSVNPGDGTKASNEGSSQTDQGTEEACSMDNESTDEDDVQDNTVATLSSGDSDDDDASTAEIFLKKTASVIKRSSDYKKIMDKLDDDGILSKDEQKQLDGSRNLKDLGSKAGKFLLTKCQEDPEAVIGFFRKLF